MGLRLSPALRGMIVFLVALETLPDRLPKTPIIGLMAAVIVLTFLIAFIYRTAPNTHRPIRRALPGAFLAALAIAASTLAFPPYPTLFPQISTLCRRRATALLLPGRAFHRAP